MQRVINFKPVRFLLDVAGVYFAKRAARSAAELAYYLVLTFFPVLICLHGFIGFFQLNLLTALDALNHIVPTETLAILRDYVAYIGANESVALFVAGAVTTLMSASAALRALMGIMDDIYEKPRYHGIWNLIASLLFSLLLLATMYGSIVVLFTGNWFFGQLEVWLNLAIPVTGWQWLRFIILFALVFLFVLLLYRITAPREKPRPPILGGALLAAAVLVAASGLFSWFIGMSANYSLVYGSLASIIILLAWLLLCGNILILGNVFNYVWYKHKRK